MFTEEREGSAAEPLPTRICLGEENQNPFRIYANGEEVEREHNGKGGSTYYDIMGRTSWEDHSE
jgi:hypothetical protein